jgi:hypothetical protein
VGAYGCIRLFRFGLRALRRIRGGCIGARCWVHEQSRHATTAPPAIVYGPSILQAGQTLGVNNYLLSRSGAYQLVQQNDGNLVLYTPSGYSWTNTYGYGNPGATTTLTWDGNLVSSINGVVLWQSNTPGHGGEGPYLHLQNDGNLVLYRGNDTPYWSTQTGIIAPTPPPPPPPVIVYPPVASNPWDFTNPVFVGNGQTGHCIFPKDYLMAAGVSVVAGNCSGSDAERWIPSKVGSLYVFRPYYNQSLCLDIDNYDGVSNTLTPSDGARAQVYTCSGSANQSFNAVAQTSPYWQLQPQTSGGSPKCLDEDVNVPVSAGVLAYFVQHFTCVGGSNQFWRPFGTQAGPGPGTNTPPPSGDPFREGIPTRIRIPGSSLCLAVGSLTIQQESSGSCVTVTPALSAGGYKLSNTLDPVSCLSGTLSWVACTTATVWSDLDPFDQSRFPDSDWKFPIWFGAGVNKSCLTAPAGATAGAPVAIALCSPALSNQLWTDPYNWSFAAGFVDNIGNYDYAPAQVGNRLFWCTGLGQLKWPKNRVPSEQTGADAIVSMEVGSNVPPKVSKEFAFYLNPSQGLTCDPSPMKTATGYRVYYSRGDSNGQNNGVSFFETDNSGKILGTSLTNRVVVTPQINYGAGQPSVTPRPAGGYLLAFRSNPIPPMIDETALMVLDGGTGFVTNPITPASFVRPSGQKEDGAQPDIFFNNGKLYKVLVACSPIQGLLGIRSHTPDAAQLVFTREESLEAPFSGFYARGIKPLSDCADGPGIVRSTTNEASLVGGALSVWYGAIDFPNPAQGSWRLKQTTLALP